MFVSVGASSHEQRRQVVLHAALLGAGSLDAEIVKRLRGRPRVARRYLAIEGRRVLTEIDSWAPIAATLGPPSTANAAESLRVASGCRAVGAAPDWFGVICPSRLLRGATRSPEAPTDKELRLDFALEMREVPEDDDEEQGEESKILKLLQSPLTSSNALTNLLSRVAGVARSAIRPAGGMNMPVASTRSVGAVGPTARPGPVPVRFVDAPGPPGGAGGALYPEWDVHNDRYRPQWCRVVEVPVQRAFTVSAGGVEHDQVLRRRLAREGLGPMVLRRRPDGDDLDVDALIDLAVDVRSGHFATEHIYLERRKLARNLGVLILLDASGSVTDTDPEGVSVHEHQRRAAATLAVTLEELGDRVAVYGFRSQGRSMVHLLALKPFGQRFSAGGRAQLNQLEPAGYTRMGAAIRHAAELLKTDAGTPNRLLLVLSDGFPYDEGYESGYAEADARRALEEVRADGVACLCLAIGSSTSVGALQRVFDSASHANATTLADLSPRMDELFLSALKELAVGQSRR